MSGEPGASRVFVVWDSTNDAVDQSIEELRATCEGRFELTLPGHDPGCGEILRDVVLAGIRSTDRVLVVVDDPNANVGFETGLALGSGKRVAFVYYREALPAWVRSPPFNNIVAARLDEKGELARLIDDERYWFPPPEEVSRFTTTVPDDGGELLLAEGEYLHAGLAQRGSWEPSPEVNFSLRDLPVRFGGFGALTWVICEATEGHGGRDAPADAANAVIAGWFFARLKSVQEQGRGVGLEQARSRLRVLRRDDAREVADVKLLEQNTFRDVKEFKLLCECLQAKAALLALDKRSIQSSLSLAVPVLGLGVAALPTAYLIGVESLSPLVAGLGVVLIGLGLASALRVPHLRRRMRHLEELSSLRLPARATAPLLATLFPR